MPEETTKTIVEQQEYESPTDEIELWAKVKRIRDYWKTRRAILDGEPVYDYSKRQLEERKLLGAWKFNVVESTLAGLPAIAITWCLRRFVPGIKSFLPEEGFEATLDEVFAFALPFLMMVTAYVVSRAALRKQDASPSAKARATRIFLYLDGAHGLWPQIFCSVSLTIMGGVYFAGIWQAYVSLKVIPDELFKALGYSEDVPEELTNRAISGPPPKWKLRLCTLIVLPVIYIFATVLLFAAAGAVRAMLGAKPPE